MYRSIAKFSRASLLGVVVGTLAGCGTSNPTSDIASVTRAPNFAVALANPDASQRTIVLVAPLVAVNPSSVVMCVGTAAVCTAPGAQWLRTVAGQVAGRAAFSSGQGLALTEGSQIHIAAKDAAGQNIGRSIQLVRRGSTPAAVNNSTAVAAGPQQAAMTNCYKADAFLCEIEILVAQKTNAYRAQSGRPALEYSARVAYVSRLWSQQQGNRRDIGHEGFPSARVADYKREFSSMDGISLNRENVAMASGGSSAEAIAERFASMWWNSPGHKANILASGITGIGVGFVKVGGSYYGTQIFYRK